MPDVGTVVQIEDAIRRLLGSVPVSGKTGESHLKRAVAGALKDRGFQVDLEDQREFLRACMPAWRSRDSGKIERPPGRLRIDIVVYRGNEPVALVETESDLDDLRLDGKTSRRSGHYDVFSIGRSSENRFFDSYKSLERMAAAAFYWSRAKSHGMYPSPQEAERLLGSIASDSPRDHNPVSLPLFLVSGRCRPADRGHLDARLRSLGAVLFCARVGRP